MTILPWELFGINKGDYLNLSQKVKNNFNEFSKPYPDSNIIKQNYFDNKRWIKFKTAWRDNITNSKSNKVELSNTFKTVRGNVERFINAFEHLVDYKRDPFIKEKQENESSVSTEANPTIQTSK